MDNFEQKILNAVSEKLHDGTVEKLVQQYIEKGVSKVLEDLFSWNGEGKRLIEKKLSEVMVPAIERHEFNQYLIKLDSVLTEIINATVLVDNRKILENFKELMIEPNRREIKLSEIFSRYCKHVAKNIDTSDLKAFYEDGESYYENVTANMEVEHEDKAWFRSIYDDCTVKFTCEKDELLNCQVKLSKKTDGENWRLKGCGECIDIDSLQNLSSFEVFLMTLKRGFVHIIIDEEEDYDDNIEPEEEPEWTLN